ncbi:hypothetical protein [Legionella israelensis]|uniref:Uncharacterized protein n=1 Tax=Legionella israelensis TaxID=454 RepID=A0A0W0VGX7_9GAMM|nr:hypothetical protein [Legionella israelensis]KTD19412.1 hypothetical protein Lisr_1974 [Legionella israelensis]QBS09962.1 hypothetical protein E4T55_08890 [Legionella israelensis]SCY46731.1 hypothetical protein SAMN02746069_02558 [Legionella israelensis DSM 19235]STX59531.1 Uncharacterised protein [Legionella israelensis]
MDHWMRLLQHFTVAFIVVVSIFGLQFAYADATQNQRQATVQSQQVGVQLAQQMNARKGQSDTVIQLKRGQKGPTKLIAKDGAVEFKCNGSCLCKGAGDCVNMVYSGCCSGAVTCDDSGCSCVNGAGCDNDGNLPD